MQETLTFTRKNILAARRGDGRPHARRGSLPLVEVHCKRRAQTLHIHVGHPNVSGDLTRGPSNEAIGVDLDDEAWLKADRVSPHETP